MTLKDTLLILNAIPGISGNIVKKLINLFGSPEEVLCQKYETLLGQGLNQTLVTNIIHFPKDKFLEGEYNLLKIKDVDVLTYFDDAYPTFLKQINQAPIVLYIKGNSSFLKSPAVALVGSRKASYYGMKIAEEFSSAFAQTGLTVVSGLAYGIDTASHQGCLKMNGQTVAVLGCGLNHVYPKENTQLFEDVAQKGLLVSEFPMNTTPLAYNFPRRNRIISGLSLATIVVEAAEKSGALITADYAIEQNREVFVIPGNIDSVYSQGTNRLIKDGAKMALSPQEVLLELGFEIQNYLDQENSQLKPHIQLSVDEYKVFEFVHHQPEHIDVIATHCKQDIGVLMGQMVNLELKGVIKQLPGQYYVRI